MGNKPVLEGMKKALPICLGYFPLGLAFGVIAQNTGLSMVQVGVMSLLVFSGSGQFIAVALLSLGVSFWSIIFTILLVNSRYMLFSASVSRYVKKFPSPLVALITQGITDETFVVSTSYFKEHPVNKKFWLALNITSHLTWISSTMLGVAVGNFIPDMEKLGLNFALPAMFIALFFMTAENKKGLIVGALAGVLSVLFIVVGLKDANVILATVIAATAGVMVKNGF
ncbi:MAG: hypothetical protein PWQ96_2015 [Clostridia bacterium]|jgi:4-azaleucine resistance transporter AzlC|nr:AzlC family protein [Clostridiales bacterium]MDK2986371.1 hypothetical protein [Clostridia bacterium]